MGIGVYELKTRPCTIRRGKFRWTICENGFPLQFSLDSFSTEAEAVGSGFIVLKELEQKNAAHKSI
jgi:hypothetical protein